jgi:hypothetical protein
MPFMTINFNDPTEVAKHDELVEAGKRMLSLGSQLAAVSVPYERGALNRRMRAEEDAIDRRVFDLFGLTSSAIDIISEAQRPVDVQPSGGAVQETEEQPKRSWVDEWESPWE